MTSDRRQLSCRQNFKGKREILIVSLQLCERNCFIREAGVVVRRKIIFMDKIRLGLSSIEKLLEKVGNPQNDFKTIHVAGTVSTWISLHSF
jgi:hypothetical protein